MNTSKPARYRGIRLEPLLTEVEVMKILKVSRPRLRELVRDGRIPALEFMQHARFMKQEVVDFLEGSAPKDEVKRESRMFPRQKQPQNTPVSTPTKPLPQELLKRFGANWILIGNSPATLKEYDRHLRHLLDLMTKPTLLEVEKWLANEPSMAVRRMKGRAIRSFGRWMSENGVEHFGWWEQVPLAKEVEKEQPTVSAEDYAQLTSRELPPLVRLIVELLWSTGMRRSELAQVLVTNVDLEKGTVLVEKSKTDEPRLTPLTDEAIRLLKRHLPNHTDPRLIGHTSQSIRKLLRRHGIASAHCFRRGWTVDALRRGINQVDVETAAGWSSGAMVRRYTRKFRNQVAIENFRKIRSSSTVSTPPKI